jgi:hypothetical protein
MALQWGSPWGQILLGIVANVVSLIVVTLAAVWLTRMFSRRRRRLTGFFASGKHWSRDVRIMMSNIYLATPGATSATPAGLGFSGATMTLGEQIYAQRLVDAIEGRPSTRLLSALGDQIGLDGAAGKVRCRLSVSPLLVDGAPFPDPRHVDDGVIGAELAEVLRRGDTLVLVGGVVFNTLTRYVLRQRGDQSWFAFESGPEAAADSSKRALRASANGSDVTFTCRKSEVDGVEVFTEYFFVQKVTGFGTDHSTIFICAGTSTAATVAAVEMLTEWEPLQAEFGDGSFAVLCSLETSKRKPWQLGDELKPDVWRVTRVWTPPRR